MGRLATGGGLEASLQDALGECNRDVPRLGKVEITGEVVWVQYAIDDNLTSTLLLYGAYKDMATVLETLERSDVQYVRVRVQGSFAMRDLYGNVEEDTVVDLFFDRETARRVRWEAFDYLDLPRIADNVRYVHREFRPEE